ncbi:FkbM family methyltransferase [Azospirillum melinis]|uniref:FkbM family methyltransferase n=1 Tax=Azospirillum melinis TaxID=328839 RepID=UPI003757B776
MEISYSQEGEDRVLQRIFDGKSVGLYVDVGAHHPFRFSNTFAFYMKGWSGVNIDATPGSMALFRKHRPRDINLEHLVGDGDEPLSFTIFDEPALNSAEVGRDAALSDRYTVIERVSIAPRRLDNILDEWLPPARPSTSSPSMPREAIWPCSAPMISPDTGPGSSSPRTEA